MNTGRRDRFDVVAELAAALIVRPVLPLAELGVAFLGVAVALRECAWQRRVDAATQVVDARLRRVRVCARSGFDRCIERAQRVIEFADQCALLFLLLSLRRVRLIERRGEARLRDQRCGDRIGVGVNTRTGRFRTILEPP